MRLLSIFFYIFSVDYDNIDVDHFLDIHKHSMKNTI